MAIKWSSTSGHLRVGIEVRTGTITTSTTSTTVYRDYYAQSQAWGYSDPQTLNYGGSLGSGTISYTASMASGSTTTQFIGTKSTSGVAVSYGGGPTYTFTASISGAYDGSSPSLSYSWTLPARPADQPGTPGVTISTVTANSAKIVLSAPSSNGSSIDQYQTQVSTSSGFGSTVVDTGSTNFTASGLAAATKYYVRSRAHNGVGWGSFSTTKSFTTGATTPGTPTGLAVTTGSITTTSIPLTWTAPASDGGSDIDHYNVQYATNSAMTGATTVQFDTSPGVVTGLAPGQPYWFRVNAENGVGAGSNTGTVTATTLAATPTITYPTTAQAINEGFAKAIVKADGVVAGNVITVQFSQDNTFTTGVITLTYTATGSISSGVTIQDTSQYLKHGGWWARAQLTAGSYTSPWSLSVSYNELHQPSATLVSPTQGAVSKYTGSVALNWNFVDAASTVDTQTAYRVVVEDSTTGTVIFDSNKVSSALHTATVTIGSAYKNVVLRWKVMVWDRGDTASSYTGYGLFSLSDAPAPVIVTPANGTSLTTGAPTFTWTNSIPSGGVQTKAVVTVIDSDTSAQVYKTTIVGTATSVTPPTYILLNGHNYYATLDVTDTYGLVGSTSSSFSATYSAPDVISYNIDCSGQDSVGYNYIDWSNANPDGQFMSWKVYRRLGIGGNWELIFQTGDINDRDYRDYLLVSGLTYEYTVSQTAQRSGQELESPVGYYYTYDDLGNPILNSESRDCLTTLTAYWIVVPDSQALSVRLAGVTDSPDTLEFDTAVYTIIGRGRHQDYGDELGYSGTLTVKVRNAETPSSFRLAVETLRRAQETYYLRTPFGRLFQVALGNIGWTPLAGVGSAEMGDMSIPYVEVE